MRMQHFGILTLAACLCVGQAMLGEVVRVWRGWPASCTSLQDPGVQAPGLATGGQRIEGAAWAPAL